MSLIQSGVRAPELFENYDPGEFYDEMFSAPGVPRPHYNKMFRNLAAKTPAQFEERRQLADLSFLLQGITFTVYSDGAGTKGPFPLGPIPRIAAKSDWVRSERSPRPSV